MSASHCKIVRYVIRNLTYLIVLWLLSFGMGCSQDKLEFGIEGVIVGENGQPISSAVVSIDGSENQSIVADNMGWFFIGGIASGYTRLVLPRSAIIFIVHESKLSTKFYPMILCSKKRALKRYLAKS